MQEEKPAKLWVVGGNEPHKAMSVKKGEQL